MNINLNIERLILEGLPILGSERGLLQAAVEAELARLLADACPSMAARNETRITAGPFRYSAESTAQQLGRQIGASVFFTLNPPARETKPAGLRSQTSVPSKPGLSGSRKILAPN